MRHRSTGEVPDSRWRQRDEIKADLHRFTEVDANVTERVRQCLEWIVRPDRQGGQRKVRRPREDELGSGHVNARRERLEMHGGFSSHERFASSVMGDISGF
ncbi:hypothetical protein [Amycolatopsis sp. lyj-23]|uniref:hypothetical protein n=1 Tax=Amycolatopsis sp. lyj-23 TaxID=2789283 RepID=UPI00397881BE